MKAIKKSNLSWSVQAALLATSLGLSASAQAQENQQEEDSLALERIQVTAQKRTQNADEVPLSVSALNEKALEVLGSSGMDVRLMSARVPSLLIESSFGRTFPRFYIRGLGNTDFDLLASQPVSLVYDDVVLENALLKGFPVFDVERVEVLRGPQGTLFGRNTTAGMVKFDSKKPSHDFDASVSASYGSFNTTNFEAAMGGSLVEDVLAFRVAALKQDRDDYIDNKAPGFEQKDQLGGFDESAARMQLLFTPNDNFSALLNYHYRNAEADARVFRANIIKPGTNELVEDFERDVVYHDAASRNRQWVDMQGGSLKLEYDFGDYTLTSVSGYETAEIFSVGDIDGGYGASFLPTGSGPGEIPFPSETGASMPDHKQLTQELRLSSNELGAFDFQVGLFLFDESLTINNLSFDTLANGAQNGLSTQDMDTKAWAIFFSGDYEVSDKLTVTAGIRYSDDERDWKGELVLSPFGAPGFNTTANVEDSQVSWDLSASYELDATTNIYSRIARGYRAPSIQGRNLLFSGEPTTADAETMLSWEAGVKKRFWDNRARLNSAIYYYTVSDQQLTAVGGDQNTARLLNADKSVGYGAEADLEVRLTEDLLVTTGLSYNHTEIKDDELAVQGCRTCTVTDPQPAGMDGFAYIDGNPLPQAPEWIASFTAHYAIPMGAGEFFAYTDWSYRSEVNFFLYESQEFKGKPLLEGGIRLGYAWSGETNDYEVAVFGRNITNEEKLTGAIDFNNLTGYTNEPRFWGIEFKADFF